MGQQSGDNQNPNDSSGLGKRLDFIVAKISCLIVDHPKKTLLMAVLFFLSLAPGLLKFEEKYDVRMWFRETDPNIKVLDKFERQFGNDENLTIVFHSKKGIFEPKSMAALAMITEEAWKISQVMRVDSLVNYNYVEANNDEIIINPFIDKNKLNDSSYLAVRKAIALEHPMIPNYLLSPDGKTAMVFARLVTVLNDSPVYQTIIAEARQKLLPLMNDPDFTVHLTGEAGVNDAFREISKKDVEKILPAMMLVLACLLYYVLRSWKATVLPLLLMGMTILMTFGLCFYLGMKYNEILSILPGILVACGIADGVHVLVSFFQLYAQESDESPASQRRALIHAVEKNMVPTFMTMATTSVGFFSFLTTELVPIRELSILAGIGVAFAWLLTMFMMVPILSMLSFKVPGKYKRLYSDKLQHFYASKMTAFTGRFKWSIIVFFTVTGFLSLAYGLKSEINSNPYLYFKKGISIRAANDFVKDAFGGNSGPEMVIDSGEEEGINDPAFLHKVEAFKNWANAQPYVNKTVDVVDIVKEMNQAVNGGKKEFYRIPDKREQVAELLFLYTMGLPQGMDLNNRMTLNKDSLRMSILWKLEDTRGWLNHVELFEAKAREFGLKVATTGKFLLFQRMMDYVVMTFVNSTATAGVLVGLMMFLMFRSVKIGLLSMIPNIVPLFYGAAIMRGLNMQLNIGTVLVASVTLGIAVDDTIHFLSNYFRLIKEGRTAEEAIYEIFTYTGEALMYTTFILMAGFGLYVFGDFIPNINFGILCAIVLLVALLTDLFMTPALLLVTDRLVNSKKNKASK